MQNFKSDFDSAIKANNFANISIRKEGKEVKRYTFVTDYGKEDSFNVQYSAGASMSFQKIESIFSAQAEKGFEIAVV